MVVKLIGMAEVEVGATTEEEAEDKSPGAGRMVRAEEAEAEGGPLGYQAAHL